MFRSSLRVAAFLTPSAIACCSQTQREKELNENVFAISNRLKHCLVSDNLVCSKADSNGIQICRVKAGALPKGGLPTMRVAKARIHSPAEEVKLMS